MSLQSYTYKRGGDFMILDQLLLPHQHVYVKVDGVDKGWSVINKMQVRGAPLIGIVAALSLAVEVNNNCQPTSTSHLADTCAKHLSYLVTARPTAVNIQHCQNRFTALLNDNASQHLDVVKEKLLVAIEKYASEDVEINKDMAAYGAAEVLSAMNSKGQGQMATILTHCNTGSLATGGYGTALGVVRSLHERKRLTKCYCTETRPYNQGARLTSYELMYDNIPSTLICDSMCAALMKSTQISAVLIGADRVAANGDTANKIGSYQLALVAKHHNVPFFVVAPRSSIDLNMETGSSIVIEQRPSNELTTINSTQIAPKGMDCWNPAFDVTPGNLITAIITEHGSFKPSQLKQKLMQV